MGTEVHCKSSFEGYYSMRDVNEDSNSSNWPLYYGHKGLTNGHYYNNGFTPRNITDADSSCDKDALKQKMLEHEAIFKNQVYELHRLYRRQRDMMEEFKRNEYHKHRISIDTSSSSSLLPSQKPYEDGQKWQIPNFPPVNSCARPSLFGADISNSPLSCSKGNNNNNNNNSSKDCEITESRPLKVRKKLFDLELMPDENIDQEHEEVQCKQASEESSYKDTSSGQCFRGSNGLADLNEPINVDEPMAKPKGLPFHGPTRELYEKSQNGAFNPLLVEGKGNGRDWLSTTRETGNSRSNMNFTPGTYPQISTRVHENYCFAPAPFPNSCTSSSYPYMNPTDLVNRNGSLSQKLTSFQKQPPFLSSPQTHVAYGDKLRMYGCFTPNGFYHGSASGSRDPYARLPAGGFDNRQNNNLDRSQKMFKGSNFIDLTDTNKGIDLNNDNNSSRKRDQTAQTMLPWLQAKPDVGKNDSREKGKINNGKILGFPVFGNSCVSRNESSSLVSTSASLRRENGKVKTEMENRGFDINVAWDDPENKQSDVGEVKLEKKTETETEKIKNNFDLNSCLTEVEDVVIVPKSVKRTLEIDLEAPAVSEVNEEDEATEIDECNDELLAKVAAEAIVEMTGISSQQDQVGSTSEVAVRSDDSDDNINDRLQWFVQVMENAGFVPNELDEFEELTLQQELTKEEDYMPKPLAVDFQEPEEAGPGSSSGPARPRRGQARRGRPRRDFQRDILPGLVSLSRHEVTEDLQVFGGLMKATGHSWNVGPTRRNGTRGRRKSVAVAVEPPPPAVSPPPPPPLSEVVGLEEGSLTGWGKTTRRPRRQRCAAGTSVAVPLM
ncbi:uncharacterized protein LOC143614426 [Bidens hawaiensis]|uniref:uncharacterized protein LOC143614426 n=1 Tax=Bidens hawaiensis TaxID=980011 RepID=UPI004048FD9B